MPAAPSGVLATELTLARSGAIDAALSAQQPFYGQYYANIWRTPSAPPTGSQEAPRPDAAPAAPGQP